MCFFKVFLKHPNHLQPLQPIVSHVIRDKKHYSGMQIVDISDDSSPVKGGKKIMIFCEKIASKDDVEIHFLEHEPDSDKVAWSARGQFSSENINRLCGVSFYTPPYRDQSIAEPVPLTLRLFRPSDGTMSDPIPFHYVPTTEDPSTPAVTQPPPIFTLKRLDTDEKITIRADESKSEGESAEGRKEGRIRVSTTLFAEEKSSGSLSSGESVECSKCQVLKPVEQLLVSARQDYLKLKQEHEEMRSREATMRREVEFWKDASERNAAEARRIETQCKKPKEVKATDLVWVIREQERKNMELARQISERDNGYKNMAWLLEQKEEQTKRLEERLRYTFAFHEERPAKRRLENAELVPVLQAKRVATVNRPDG